MSLRSIGLTGELQTYVLAHSAAPDDVLNDLAAETLGLGGVANMQIAADQGAFLTLLAKIVGVRHAVEVGTFTGYSSISIARGLAEGGRLLCCDVSEQWTSVARRYWERAGLAERIDLRIAPAAETLRVLPEERYIDFGFIDADKTGYPVYWEEIVSRLRPGGVVTVDNVLQDGKIIDEHSGDKDVVAVRAFNDQVMADERVEAVMLPLADGLTVARRL
jgi:caffeoyl-CoA O-methyltransferase